MRRLRIRAALGIERRLDLDDARAQSLHHRLDDVIAADAQAFRHDLGRQVAVAEVPGPDPAAGDGVGDGAAPAAVGEGVRRDCDISWGPPAAPQARVDISGDWGVKLADVKSLGDISPWRMAVVLETSDQSARIGVQPGRDPLVPEQDRS